VLERTDLDVALSHEEYERVFPALQERLRQLQYALLDGEVPTVVVFEGWDAAGKGTIIQRLTRKLDPRALAAWPAAAPSELEQRYHFLWPYQIRLPEDGHMALFDRSWYSRVLLDRVERSVTRRECQAAYPQINEFERWLADDGQVLVKLWFHISKKEQARRLRRMEKEPAERWKVGRKDWRRNRRYEKWLRAAEEMLARTDTPAAPWTVVEATDARWTRVKVFRTLIDRMQSALDRRQRMPAAVSRTHLAEVATRGARARRVEEDLARARTVAHDAGLPLEDSGFFAGGDEE